MFVPFVSIQEEMLLRLSSTTAAEPSLALILAQWRAVYPSYKKDTHRQTDKDKETRERLVNLPFLFNQVR